MPELVKATGASLLVTDFGPLRLGRQWREAVAGKLEVPFHEVDAHNVVPVWVASGAQTMGDLQRCRRTLLRRCASCHAGRTPHTPTHTAPAPKLTARDANTAQPPNCPRARPPPPPAPPPRADKREYAARTIRPKIHSKLPEFLTEFPELEPQARGPRRRNLVLPRVASHGRGRPGADASCSRLRRAARWLLEFDAQCLHCRGPSVEPGLLMLPFFFHFHWTGSRCVERWLARAGQRSAFPLCRLHGGAPGGPSLWPGPAVQFAVPTRTLVPAPDPPPWQAAWEGAVKPEPVDWDGLLAEVLERGKAVPEVQWCQPGEDAAMEVRQGGLKRLGGRLQRSRRRVAGGESRPADGRARTAPCASCIC